jgi:hypothetical protein
MEPGHIFRTSLPTVTITEELLSAYVRPFESQREAQQLVSGGLYRPGRPLQEYGWVVVSCRTSQGLLEFAVQRGEEHLLMVYIDIIKHRQAERRGDAR